MRGRLSVLLAGFIVLLLSGCMWRAPLPPLEADNLPLAVYMGDEEAVASFVSEGADVNAPVGRQMMHPRVPGRPEWETPLWVAVREDDPEMVALLISSGADSNLKTGPLDQSAIFGAACFDNREALRALITHGANINLQDRHGQTPLHWAASVAEPKTVELMLELGADTSIRSSVDAGGKTPLETFESCGQNRDVRVREEIRKILSKGSRVASSK